MISRRIPDLPRGPRTIQANRWGCSLLAGTSGVGKTETALALAEALSTASNNVITLRSERIPGSPQRLYPQRARRLVKRGLRREAACSPKQYGESLTAWCCWTKWRRRTRMCTNCFSRCSTRAGWKTVRGESFDFKHTLILLTTNVGTDLIARQCCDPLAKPEPQALAKALRKPLLEVFPPALLGTPSGNPVLTPSATPSCRPALIRLPTTGADQAAHR